MALIKCGNCGSEVSNIGKCPKCGALICQECGHVLGEKEVKCSNCGKGTIFLKKKIRQGWISLGFCAIAWPFFLLIPLIEIHDGNIPPFAFFCNILGLFAYFSCFFRFVYNFLRYGVRNRYS